MSDSISSSDNSSLLPEVSPRSDSRTISSSSTDLCSNLSRRSAPEPLANQLPISLPFDNHSLPVRSQLLLAAGLPVFSESGEQVRFGSIWERHKTITIFIRHFMCPFCQDYLFSISRCIPAGVLRTQGVDLVIISNGDHKMIKSYRKIFATPFAIYTDPTHKVYKALGMTRSCLDKGPRATYVRHGTASGIRMVVANAVRVRMPIWMNGGNISQLGGEFILGPGLQCAFAHRMRYTRDHLPVLELVKEAGINMTAKLKLIKSTVPSMTVEDEEKWMAERKKKFFTMMERKQRRRGGDQYCDGESCQLANDSDIE